MKKYRLRLYVTGRVLQSRQAIENLEAICNLHVLKSLEVEVIDVLEHPQLAERDRILATPTLVRRLPGPVRKIMGDLSDRRSVMNALEIDVACAPAAVPAPLPHASSRSVSPR